MPVPAAPPPQDLQHLIDHQPLSSVPWQGVLLCAAAVFLDGYDLQVMALVVPSLAQAWHIAPTQFGWALAAMVVGVTVGAAFLAPLSDRWGRRPALIGALALVGLATLAGTTANSPGQFVVWRLLTGLGLGVCIPVCNAWTAEVTPLRRRGLILILMNAAIGIGAFSAGLLVPGLLASSGWRGPFYLGGIAPLAIAALVWLLAPESLKFLWARRPDDPRIPGLLGRLAGDLAPGHLAAAPDAAAVPKGSVRSLLTPALRTRTLTLWAVQCGNRFTLHLLTAWLPTLLLAAGWPLAAASKGAVMIQAGGVVGGIGLSFLMDSGRTVTALRAVFMLAATCLLLFQVVPLGAGWFVLLALVGLGCAGTQLALNALSTAYYPPAIKATGMGWAGVMSGWGSMAAPVAGAWLLRQGLPPAHTLAWIAVPVLLCALGTWRMRQDWQRH